MNLLQNDRENSSLMTKILAKRLGGSLPPPGPQASHEPGKKVQQSEPRAHT